jgi:hypothetical protein
MITSLYASGRSWEAMAMAMEMGSMLLCPAASEGATR